MADCGCIGSSSEDYLANLSAELTAQALDLADHNKLDQAIELFRGVIEMVQNDPNGAEEAAWFNLAGALQAAGRNDEAALAYSRGEERYID